MKNYAVQNINHGWETFNIQCNDLIIVYFLSNLYSIVATFYLYIWYKFYNILSSFLFKLLSFKIFIYFYWNIVVLQSCIRFCYTTKWINYTYTCISSLSSLPSIPPSHPSRSSQSTELSSLWYTVASHKLSVLYMVMHICQCNSLNSSPAP